MTNKEKQYIKELGQLYIQTGEYEHVSCGGGYSPKYKPVNVLEYIEQQEYNENLGTYMKYRNALRYSKDYTCGGGSYMREASHGTYVRTDEGKYIDIKNLESKIKPEDIERLNKKSNAEKYKGLLRFSKIQMEGGKYFAYVEDVNGNYVYNKDAQKFIDIS